MTDSTQLADTHFDAEWDAFVREAEATSPDGLADEEARIDWYLEKIRAIEAEFVDNAAFAKRRRDMIDDWEAGESMRLEKQRKYLVGQIGILAPNSAAEAEVRYGKKSRNLPNGRFGWKRVPDHIEVTDEAAALQYAIEHGLAVKKVVSVTKTTLKNTGKSEGVGWHKVKGTDVFFVTPAP